MNSTSVVRPTLLLVDDEEANLDLLEAFLRPDGYEDLIRTTDARDAIRLFVEHEPDIVLLDLHMPHVNGFEVLREIRERTAPDVFVPVLILTADVSQDARERALGGGAQDFLTKPLDAVEVSLRVRNLLETRSLHVWQRTAREAAERAGRRAMLLADASRALQVSLDAATALEGLASVIVPAFADGCTIEPSLESGEGRVVRHAGDTSQPVTDDTTQGRVGNVPGDILTPAGDRTVRVPISVAGEPQGRLTLVRGDDRPPFDDDERALAAEIASRTGMALENVFLISEAQRAARARDHVLSVVAHDLRNPLTAIVANAEMIRQLMPVGLDAAHIRALQKIEQIAWRTHQMAEDLLELSRLDHEPFVLRPAAVDLCALFAEAESMLQVLAKARAIALTFEGPTGIGAVIADGPRLAQVLSNLVGNALKFTPAEGSVRVHWCGDENGIIVGVTDTGPGIPVDRVPELFRPFWQADPSDRRGVGLGLMIARAIVEAHGGRIWVESTEGAGATFRFTIPRDAASKAPAA